MIYEFATKTPTGFIRNKFGIFEEVKKWAKDAGNLDVYSSIFGYENQAVETCTLYGGLYFDLDNQDLALAYEDLGQLLKLFEEQGVGSENYTICFSGNKGFHLVVSPVALAILPDIDLPKVYRQIAEELATYLPNSSLDLKVYERRRLWRLANSQHGESKLFKIQLPYPLPTLEKILKLSRNQQPLNPPKATTSVVLSGWIKRARRQLYEPKETKPGNKTFVQDLARNINSDVEELLKGVGEGSRNSTCFYLACYLNSKGFSEVEIKQYLIDFGLRCSPPLNEREVEITLQSAMKPRPL